MSTKKIPQYGDPEILPKGLIKRPSAERQIFDNRGRRQEPILEERFYEAPDLAGLPQWQRKRGDEWTTAEFRAVVFEWLIGFFGTREWAGAWDVKEVASAPRSGRLPHDRWHLVLGIKPKGRDRLEVAVMFPMGVREDADATRAVLDLAGGSIDAAYAAQG